VLVSGEAGIGKSALVKRFAERRTADARFLLGACDPLLIPRALGPLHDIARQAGGRLAALLAAGSPREELFAALLDELDQPSRPQVLVVEDAHWADEATLDLLVFLGRRLERTPAMLIVTYRNDELAADHPLLTVVTSLPREAVRRLPLPPLSERATAELAHRAGRSAAGVRALTGGNPLLVTEVLAAGEPGVPATVRDLVLARLAGLPADAQKVVRLVAAIPTRTELWLHAGLPHRGDAGMGVAGDRAGPAAGRQGDPQPRPHQHWHHSAARWRPGRPRRSGAGVRGGDRCRAGRPCRPGAGQPGRQHRGDAGLRQRPHRPGPGARLRHRARPRRLRPLPDRGPRVRAAGPGGLGGCGAGRPGSPRRVGATAAGGIGAVYALVALGRLQARRGDPKAAATLQEARERSATTGELQWIGPVATARAEHAWLHGETHRVAEEAASAFGLAVEARHPWFAGELASPRDPRA
jgi:AAA ATPase domain